MLGVLPVTLLLLWMEPESFGKSPVAWWFVVNSMDDVHLYIMAIATRKEIPSSPERDIVAFLSAIVLSGLLYSQPPDPSFPMLKFACESTLYMIWAWIIVGFTVSQSRDKDQPKTDKSGEKDTPVSEKPIRDKDKHKTDKSKKKDTAAFKTAIPDESKENLSHSEKNAIPDDDAELLLKFKQQQK